MGKNLYHFIDRVEQMALICVYLFVKARRMIFSTIEHDPTARAVERQIEMLILEGILCAGDKLPGERDLSKSLNVSRPILRQAISSLKNKKLLIARHGGATLIADVIGTVFAPPVADIIRNNAKAKADYLEYRSEVESVAASMAADRATVSDKAVLERITEEMKRAHEACDPDWEAEMDVQFHNAIGDCAHNIILLHTLRSCYRLLKDDVFYNRRILYDSNGMREKLLQQHLDIYDAVVSGDQRKAARAARKHIEFIQAVSNEFDVSETRSKVSDQRLEQRENRRHSKKKPSQR